MPESIDQDPARAVRLDHLLAVFSVGSGEWSWRDEYDNLISQDRTRDLIDSIKVDGIREPILLGTDGRVWDGHHRITVAMHLGLDSVPVEFAGQAAQQPETRTPTQVEFVARRGGKVRAQMDALLVEAEQRGVHIEVVYPETRITDEMVANGGKALYVIHDTDDWGKTAPEIAARCEEVARAVLVAALEGNS